MSRPPEEPTPALDPWSQDGQTPVNKNAAVTKRRVDEQQAKPAPAAPAQRVVVTEIAVPFGSLVAFGIKLVLAAVPALILLMIIIAGLFAIAGTLLGGAIVTMLTSALTQALGWIGWPW